MSEGIPIFKVCLFFFAPALPAGAGDAGMRHLMFDWEVSMELKEFFRSCPRAALAFSGGTDSAYLLYAAREYGCNVRAYYVHTAFQPAFELADARRLAAELGAPLPVLEADILACPQVAANPPDRCYH